jgi:hypothetical protein
MPRLGLSCNYSEYCMDSWQNFRRNMTHYFLMNFSTLVSLQEVYYLVNRLVPDSMLG